MCDVRCFSSAREAAHLDIRPEFGAAAHPPRAPAQLIHGQLQVPGVGMESWEGSEAAGPACLGPNVQAPLGRRWGGTACAVGNGKQHTHEVGERACRSGRWGVDAVFDGSRAVPQYLDLPFRLTFGTPSHSQSMQAAGLGHVDTVDGRGGGGGGGVGRDGPALGALLPPERRVSPCMCACMCY